VGRAVAADFAASTAYATLDEPIIALRLRPCQTVKAFRPACGLPMRIAHLADRYQHHIALDRHA